MRIYYEYTKNKVKQRGKIEKITLIKHQVHPYTKGKRLNFPNINTTTKITNIYPIYSLTLKSISDLRGSKGRTISRRVWSLDPLRTRPAGSGPWCFTVNRDRPGIFNRKGRHTHRLFPFPLHLVQRLYLGKHRRIDPSVRNPFSPLLTQLTM